MLLFVFLKLIEVTICCFSYLCFYSKKCHRDPVFVCFSFLFLFNLKSIDQFSSNLFIYCIVNIALIGCAVWWMLIMYVEDEEQEVKDCNDEDEDEENLFR